MAYHLRLMHFCCLLALGILFVFAADSGAEAKRKKLCSLKVIAGRYTFFCQRGRSARKAKESVQKREQRKIKQRGLPFPKSKQKSKKALRKFGNIRVKPGQYQMPVICQNMATKWIPKNQFPSADAVVSCSGRQYLQSFKIDNNNENFRYNYTCCMFM